MVEGIAGAAPSCRRGVVSPVTRRCCGGGGCALGRLVRRQGKQTLCAARPATTLRGCQYDMLSYARNFDQSGFGGGGGDADSSDDAEANLYYSHIFSSRFVLASSQPPPSAAAAAPTGLITARPAATSH